MSASSADDNPPLSRKAFLKKGFFSLAGMLVQQAENLAKPLTRRLFLRPPGAQAEALFLALCTRCDACTAACPHEAISVHYGGGAPHDGTPVLANLREHPCLLCEDMPCIAACPTKALAPVSGVREVKIGTAEIDTLACSAFYGSKCQTCYDVCPLPDEAIALREGLPHVIADACTGCGICQQACPEAPEAIRVYPM